MPWQEDSRYFLIPKLNPVPSTEVVRSSRVRLGTILYSLYFTVRMKHYLAITKRYADDPIERFWDRLEVPADL